MPQAFRSPRAPRGAYFYLMLCLWILFGLGLLLLILGIAGGVSPLRPPVMNA